MAQRKRKAGVKKKGLKLRKRVFTRVMPDEWYVGKFTKIGEGQGQYGQYWRLSYKLLNGETEEGESAKGVSVVQFVNQPDQEKGVAEIGEKTPLYKLLRAFGEPMKKIFDEERDFTLDLDKYIGMKLRILVEDSTGADSSKQRVTSFSRYRPRKK